MGSLVALKEWNIRRKSESIICAPTVSDSVRKLFRGKEGIEVISTVEEEDPIIVVWPEDSNGSSDSHYDSGYNDEEGIFDIRYEKLGLTILKQKVVRIAFDHGSIWFFTATHAFLLSVGKLYKMF